MKKNHTLTPETRHVLIDKGTEPPALTRPAVKVEYGTYLCRGCGTALFRASSEFQSGCGWPSFDDEIDGAIERQADADGRRTEILCNTCKGHLGHAFTGEGKTAKNLRHCVNSLAIEFVKSNEVLNSEEAILAAGCFWGVQQLLDELPGVLLSEVGYTGGDLDHPSYEQVCEKNTGHFEATRIIFNPEKLSYGDLLKFFFEIHNPVQADGQGPDIGSQYLSAIFYYDETQKTTAEKIIAELKQMKIEATTQLLPATIFWPAETHHQKYYQKQGGAPYCHRWTKKFSD